MNFALSVMSFWIVGNVEAPPNENNIVLKPKKNEDMEGVLNSGGGNVSISMQSCAITTIIVPPIIVRAATDIGLKEKSIL